MEDKGNTIQLGLVNAVIISLHCHRSTQNHVKAHVCVFVPAPTYVSLQGSCAADLYRHPQLDADIEAVKDIYTDSAVSVRYGTCTFFIRLILVTAPFVYKFRM